MQPAKYEAFGLTVIEAMTCGLPVIVTNRGGPVEIVVDQVSGFHIDPFQARPPIAPLLGLGCMDTFVCHSALAAHAAFLSTKDARGPHAAAINSSPCCRVRLRPTRWQTSWRRWSRTSAPGWTCLRPPSNAYAPRAPLAEGA